MADFKLNPHSHPRASEYQNEILKRVEMVTESGCWIWMGNNIRAGYGRFLFQGVSYAAHRFSYEAFRGPIPKGLTCDHLCRVRCCCNPWHLEPVPHKVNIQRGESGKHLSDRTHCPHGHPYNDANTIIRTTGARKCRECARQYCERKHRAAGVQYRDPNACPQGHPFSPDNTTYYTHRDGRTQRVCVACYRARIERSIAHKRQIKASATACLTSSLASGLTESTLGLRNG